MNRHGAYRDVKFEYPDIIKYHLINSIEKYTINKNSVCDLDMGFYPFYTNTQEDNEHINKLLEKHYYIFKNSENKLNWENFIDRRTGRYHKMSYEVANQIMNKKIEKAKDLHDKNCMKSEDDIDCNRLKNMINMNCDNPFNWVSTEYVNKFSDRNKLIDLDDNLLDNGKTFLLGRVDMFDKIRWTKERKNKYVVMPFEEEYLYSTMTSWNVLVNMAMVVCALKKLNSRFPLRFFLLKDWSKSLDIDPYNKDIFKYKGFIILKFDTLKHLKEDYKSFKNPLCNTIILHVFEDSRETYTYSDVFWTKYSLFNVNGNRVDWGDFSSRKRITYYEIRQTMTYLNTEGYYAYQLDNNNFDDILISKYSV